MNNFPIIHNYEMGLLSVGSPKFEAQIVKAQERCIKVCETPSVPAGLGARGEFAENTVYKAFTPTKEVVIWRAL